MQIASLSYIAYITRERSIERSNGFLFEMTFASRESYTRVTYAFTSSRTCSYEGGGELGIGCSLLTDRQLLSASVSAASANSSTPVDGND